MITSLFSLICILLVTPTVQAETVKLTFLLTNDIHGHLEPSKLESGKKIGGLEAFGTILQGIRNQEEYRTGKSGLFLLDSGDQFPGTLVSNYDEGATVFKTMRYLKYDAVIPGNHDYDFGPFGWLYDKVTPGKTSANPREVIETISTRLESDERHRFRPWKNPKLFPLLSANTYFRDSIRTKGTRQIIPVNASCEPSNQSVDPSSIDFENAKRPSFLKPYVIIKKAGVRVAFIGIDNKSTSSVTTPANVSDLCFRDEVSEYLETRKQIEAMGGADVYVLLMHNGNAVTHKKSLDFNKPELNIKEASNTAGSDIVKAINSPEHPNLLDLAAEGHTHFTHDDVIEGVHAIQDGAEAKAYGQVDLFYDTEKKMVLKNETKSRDGIRIDPNMVTADPVVHGYVTRLREKIASEFPTAIKVVAIAKEKITKDRINENALSNYITDALRAATHTQIAIINAGGVRADVAPGTLDYESYFQVSPFANQAVVYQKFPWKTLKAIMQRSITSCGEFGALMFSGMNIQYSRTCAKGQTLDKSAKLDHVELKDSGKILFDANSSVEAADTETFSLATLDFLAGGGDNFTQFKDIPIDSMPGVARDLVAEQLESSTTPPEWVNQVDGRLKNLTP